MPKTKVAKVSVSQDQLLELYQGVQKSGGTMADVVAQYRELSNTQANDQSIKSSISNRISELRQDLASRGLSKEQVFELIPKFLGQHKKADRNASAITNAFGDRIAAMLSEETTQETVQEEN